MPCNFQSSVNLILVGSCACAPDNGRTSKVSAANIDLNRMAETPDWGRSCTDGELILAKSPARDPSFDERENDVERDAEHRENGEACKYERHVEARTRDHHHVANAAIGRHRFGDDGA